MKMMFKISVLAAIVSVSCVSSCGGSKKDDDQTPNSSPIATPLPTEAPPAFQPPSPKSEDSTAIFKPNEGIAAKQGKFVVKLDWLSGPKSEDFVKARLTFATTQRAVPSTVSDVVFNPQMPSMGHGTSMDDQTIAADESSTNVFIVDGIWFIMGGPWEILVTAKVDGISDTAAIPVDVP